MTMLLNAIFFGCNICVTQCLKQLDENMKTTKKKKEETKNENCVSCDYFSYVSLDSHRA